jgi:hypothetical protein
MFKKTAEGNARKVSKRFKKASTQKQVKEGSDNYKIEQSIITRIGLP